MYDLTPLYYLYQVFVFYFLHIIEKQSSVNISNKYNYWNSLFITVM